MSTARSVLFCVLGLMCLSGCGLINGQVDDRLRQDEVLASLRDDLRLTDVTRDLKSLQQGLEEIRMGFATTEYVAAQDAVVRGGIPSASELGVIAEGAANSAVSSLMAQVTQVVSDEFKDRLGRLEASVVDLQSKVGRLKTIEENSLDRNTAGLEAMSADLVADLRKANEVVAGLREQCSVYQKLEAQLERQYGVLGRDQSVRDAIKREIQKLSTALGEGGSNSR